MLKLNMRTTKCFSFWGLRPPDSLPGPCPSDPQIPRFWDPTRHFVQLLIFPVRPGVQWLIESSTRVKWSNSWCTAR